MRTKLKLDLEHLLVDSFDTSGVRAENGTVFGEQCTCYTNCTCPGCPTCDNTACGQASCEGSCESCLSCYETCIRTCMETCTPDCQAMSEKYTNCNNICY